METLASGANIVGIGQTEFSRNSGRSVQRLALEAALEAATDACLPVAAIDGVVPFPAGPSAEDIISGLGLPDCRFTAVSHMGGAACVSSIRLAALAVATGAANAVLVFVARNGASGARVDERVAALLPGAHFRSNLEYPQGLNTPAQLYSLLCRRHMLEYGTTREQLGRVAVTLRSHANLNPHAQMYSRTLTMNEYLAGRPIADPYLLFDCCLETDGASAVIVANPKLSLDSTHRPVRVAGIAEGHSSSPDDIANRPNFLEVGLTKAAPRAFQMAGLSPSDVGAAFIYDCFTFEVIHQLEEAGFCARGEGGAFVESGAIGIGGSLPVNPNGGLLSEGHTGGMNNVVEAVRQLRGIADGRQIPDLGVVAITGWGDLGDGAMAILTT